MRRALRTRDGLLTERQWTRIAAVFAADAHAAVETTWCAYQQLIGAYARNDPQRDKTLLATLIDLLRSGLPAGLEELATLGRTLHRRRDDVLAYFSHRASNGRTEAINGRLEALRRNALGFRNMINYRIRSLLHCGVLALQNRKSPFSSTALEPATGRAPMSVEASPASTGLPRNGSEHLPVRAAATGPTSDPVWPQPLHMCPRLVGRSRV